MNSRKPISKEEALRQISEISLGGFEEPVDGDSSHIYEKAVMKDGFRGHIIPTWWGAVWYNRLKEAIELAKFALASGEEKSDE